MRAVSRPDLEEALADDEAGSLLLAQDGLRRLQQLRARVQQWHLFQFLR